MSARRPRKPSTTWALEHDRLLEEFRQFDAEHRHQPPVEPACDGDVEQDTAEG